MASVKEEKKKKYPLPKPTECSVAGVQNCNASQCCDNFGFQCYAKNASFAACMKKCEPAALSKKGSLEVVSKDAFGTFLDKLEDCNQTLPWRHADHAHFRYYGEDKFLQWCMDKHGVDKVPSRQMVDHVPKDEKIYGLHLTVSCPGHRSKFERPMKKWHPNCSRSLTVSMHAFRTVKEYEECLKNTTQL